jgi:hypothetical protein
MDSIDLEREKGITIRGKNARLSGSEQKIADHPAILVSQTILRSLDPYPPALGGEWCDVSHPRL